MEPENRPYVDSKTEPGDAGTEEWAATHTDSADPAGRGRKAAPVVATDGDGVVEGSPADEFINDPEVVRSRNDESPTQPPDR